MTCSSSLWRVAYDVDICRMLCLSSWERTLLFVRCAQSPEYTLLDTLSSVDMK